VVGIELHQQGGSDLRVLAAQHLADRLGIHPLELLDAAELVLVEDAADHQLCLVVVERAGQHAAHVIARIRGEQALVGRRLGKPLDHRVELFACDGTGRRDGFADLLHFLGRQITHDLRRVVLAQRHHQYRGVVETLFIHGVYRSFRLPECRAPSS